MEYRINKYISSSGFCSRREADRLIEEGQVTINGKKATIGMNVYPGQKVKVRGQLIQNDIEPVYIAFNKPVGVVSTTDPKEKDNIVDFISHEQRIYPIGRLDKDSQGLILLTNDGDIVNKILRVGNNHKKEYIVHVDKPLTDEFITRMQQGVPILDRVTRRSEIKKINPYTFQISLIQGLNRQIRRMCAYFDYEVVKLERIQIMNIELGKLGQGNWRDLTQAELEGLFKLLEESDNREGAKKSASSNKAMNKALERLDIQTDYRKSTSIAKQPKRSRPKSTSAGKRGGGAPGFGASHAKPSASSQTKRPTGSKSQAPKSSGKSRNTGRRRV